MLDKFFGKYVKIEEKEAEVSKVRNILNQEIDKYKKEIKNERKEKETTRNKLKAQIKDITSEKKQLEKELDKFKKDMYRLKKDYDKQDEALEDYAARFNNLKLKFEQQLNEIEQLSENSLISENSRLKDTNERLLNRVQSLNLQYNQMQNDYIQLEQELLVEKSLSGNTSNNQDVVIDNIKKELAAYKAKVHHYENDVEVESMIQKLKDYLSEDTLEEFESFNGLLEKVKNVRFIVEEKEREKQIKIQEAFDNPEMGYVVKDGKEWYFHTLSDNRYEIIEVPVRLIDGVPAKAAVIDSTAVIMDVYSIQYRREEPSTNRSKVKSESKDKDVTYVQFGNFKVLIVGARNKVYYTERLNNHGVEVMWHDPYEESMEQLKSKSKSADIVLLCKRHISHDVTNIVDVGNDEKVELIERDNKDTIAARTHMLAQKLGLLRREAEDALSE